MPELAVVNKALNLMLDQPEPYPVFVAALSEAFPLDSGQSPVLPVDFPLRRDISAVVHNGRHAWDPA
jgi:hypothetical protein